jgi:hypothetical protein
MKLGEESVPDGEEAAIGRVVQASVKLLDQKARPLVPRDQHPKQHGCVRAEFVVEPDLPPEYRVGLFREPKTYPAWIRLSNGGQQDDRKPDAHGMVIKLMGVEGRKILEGEEGATTHDFLLVDNPVFFIRDAIEYGAFSGPLVKAKGKHPSLVRFLLFFLPGKLRELGTLFLLFFLWGRIGRLLVLLKFVSKRIASPLTTRYWSTTPSLFGEGGPAMKFSAVPVLAGGQRPAGASADYLREVMKAHLMGQAASFEFRVQLQKDPRAQPVEDSTVLWDEASCPFVTVARIHIKPQDFDTPERMAFGENLSFTPWHAIPEHRPLGGINRTRRAVYTTLSKLRHELNEVPMQEPSAEQDPHGLRTKATAAEVIAAELEAIRKRRGAVYVPEEKRTRPEDRKKWEADWAVQKTVSFTGEDADTRLTEARLESLGEHTVGLSFSGGGIRSGTFAFGFLQGLSNSGLLRRIDYLSTVSGGGYAGSWLAAWLKRDGDPQNVEKQLNPDRVEQAKADRALLSPIVEADRKRDRVVDEEPEPVFHLRQYSSYMVPRTGFLTADTWTAIAIWLRNVTINLLMLLPLTVMIVLAARVAVYLYGFVSPTYIQAERPYYWLPWVVCLALGFVLLFVGFSWNARELGEFRSPDEEESDYRRGKSWRRAPDIERKIYWLLLAPLVLGVLGLTASVRAFFWATGKLAVQSTGGERPVITDLADRLARNGWASVGFLLRTAADYIAGHLDLLGVPNLALHVLLFGGLLAVGALHTNWKNKTLTRRNGWKYVSSAFFSGAIGGVLLTLLEVLIRSLNDSNRSELIATIVPPLGLLILVVGLVVEVALLGRVITEAEREWWARVAALLLIAAVAWLGAMGTILYVPALFLYAGVPMRLAMTSGWLGATAIGVLTGRRAGPTPTGGGGSRLLGMIPAFGPPIFLVGLLGAVSLVVSYLVNAPTPVFPAAGAERAGVALYFQGVNGTSIWTLVVWFLAAYLLFDWGKKRVDVNLFSLNAMYANRLIRCYLGASRPKARWASRWGGGHDPAAGGGASSLSQVDSRKPREPLARPTENAGAASPRPLDAPATLSSPATEDLESRRHKLEEEIKRLATRRDLLIRQMNRLRGEQADDPQRRAKLDRKSETLLRDWQDVMDSLRSLTLALLAVLDAQRAQLNPSSWRRAKIDSGRERRLAELTSYEVGQAARDANPVTGFDPRDDIPLYDLQIGGIPAMGRTYWGPYPLINTALNLVAGEELAWRDRKGESFVLAPLYCGSKDVGYARVTPQSSENLTLGRAIAISGAAVDPNMSFYQTSALTAFLTIFNARLGYWMQNPRVSDWEAGSPQFGGWLLRELFGQTDSKDDYIHLSDGGHFENLGLYELIRRRCRYIIALDAGEDIDASNDNLANLVRLARIDFGVRVELDTRSLQAEGPDRLSRTHVVIGRIHYEDVDNGQVPGILVYVKISMTGDEPSDVQKYARKDPRFPHQPTDLRQSFDEEQFESYRALGDHIARDVFADALGQLRRDETKRSIWETPCNAKEYILGNQLLFAALRGRWASPPADHDARYVELARAWYQIQRDVREDEKLEVLSRDLYPELVAPGAPAPPALTPERAAAELHAVGQMLQVMEDAWINLGMKGRIDLPTDRGWMNVFRRWTNGRAFQRVWPTLRSEFSPDFVKFCESQLHAGAGQRPQVHLVPANYAPGSFEDRAIERLNDEFRREWPDESAAGRDLKTLIQGAATLPLPSGEDGQQAARPAVWLIVQPPAGTEWNVAPAEMFACGVILVRPDRPSPKDPTETFEIFVWIRRPQRSTGVGSRCIFPVFKDIRDGLPADRSSVVWRMRYPKPSTAIEPDLELAMWKNFFALYDFKPVRDTATEAKETILEQKLTRFDGAPTAVLAPGDKRS